MSTLRTRLGLVLVIGLLGLTSTAAATDGVVEINASRAAVGGVTALDPPGYPVFINKPGSYRLTGDLDLTGETVPQDATAIVVVADHVWLDLNGFSIVGPNACAGVPPVSVGLGDGIVGTALETVVLNGYVRGLGRNGISLGAEARVEGVSVSCSGDAGVIVGEDSVVRASKASANGGAGIRVGDRSLVLENAIADNGGVALGMGAQAAYSGNQLGDTNALQIEGVALLEMGANACGTSLTCQICGDATCNPVEDCANCPTDCGACEVCGDSVCSPSETCSSCPGDCGVCPPSVAFRFSDLDLRDPHIFVSIPLVGCSDVTDSAPLSFQGFNEQLQDAITMDSEPDGLLDRSYIVVFNPLDQGASSTPVEFGNAECTDPVGSTTCTPDVGLPLSQATATNQSSGICLGVVPGTDSGYVPGVIPPTNFCFSSDEIALTLDFGSFQLPLEAARIGGEYVGTPATAIADGLLHGFVSESNADSIMVDFGTGLQSLSSALPGGTGACGPGDDKDVGPDSITPGWWFYFVFPAAEVPFAP